MYPDPETNSQSPMKMGDPWEFEIPVLETIIFRGELLVLGRVCFFLRIDI